MSAKLDRGDRDERAARTRALGAPIRAAAAAIDDATAERDPNFSPVTKIDSRVLLSLVRVVRRSTTPTALATLGASKKSLVLDALDAIEKAAKRSLSKERARVKTCIALRSKIDA